jgi:prepilin-type N-terminal cleavage/methylation domain-containing protein
MNTNKNAFTLIELLITVLIIGILAAIALPQYQIAVLKSRFATVISNTKAIKNAEEIYYLTNGNYTGTLSNLDINIPQCIAENHTGVLTCEGISYYDHDAAVVNNYGDRISGYIYNSDKTSWRIGYVMAFDRNIMDPGKIYCVISNASDKTAVRVCESLSKNKISDKKWEL